jgi:hypothetical protein
MSREGVACRAVPGRAATGVAAVRPKCQDASIMNFMSQIAVPIAIGAVAVVLLLGLFNMMRGGSPNTSQKLMRLRVLLQFVAIVVIMATIWMMGR